MLLYNQVKGREFPREKTKSEGEQNNDTITEKKVEKEVPEVMERMGNYMGRI